MSIATEITRLQTAKADIKTAIENKGVTVPSNAKLDTYDTYVAQISGGGGGTNYLAQYANGSISSAITSTQLGTNIGSTMPEYFLNNWQNITSVDLTGTGATVISGHFLNNCPHLTSCTIPSTVTSIDAHCLCKCEYLTQVIYNAPTASLPSSSFSWCPSLSLVDLNSSVSAITYADFLENTTNSQLLEVVLRKTDGIVTIPNKIGASYAFSGRTNIKIYVPSALIASYQADANWATGITNGRLTIAALEGSQYE